MVRIQTVIPLVGFSLRVTFTDGTTRVVDMTPYLEGPIFEPLRRDVSLFRSVVVDRELGTLVWPNGADICPDLLYEGITPAAAER